MLLTSMKLDRPPQVMVGVRLTEMKVRGRIESELPLQRLILVLICLLVSSGLGTAWSSESLPDKGGLKARVNQLHEAIQAPSRDAILSLVVPELLRCELALEDVLVRDNTEAQLLSWKILKIRDDDSYLEEEVCEGEKLHATAGAIVEMVQKWQEPGQPVKKREIKLNWVYVGGVWLFLSVEC